MTYDETIPPTQAWYGETDLAVPSLLRNKNYDYGYLEQYEHHKIRYNTYGKLYTGGYYQNYSEMGALFGSPQVTSEFCDIKYDFPLPEYYLVFLFSSGLTDNERPPSEFITFESQLVELNPNYCGVLKSGGAPEFSVLPSEKEAEITNFYDRITVKNVSSGTYYQIYSVTGQLLQAGTTNPDISTAQLSKGIYILRLENGKGYKFVK